MVTDEKNPDASAPTPEKRNNSLFMRMLKWTGIAVGSIIALLILALCGLMLWLTPERSTELFNRYAPQFLNAEVKASRVEFTLFSTFPHFRLDVRDLDIVSHSLRSLPPATRDSLPVWSDSLLSVKSFYGSINPLRLLVGTISVKDVEVAGMKANLVVVSDSVNNFDIVPPSGEPESKEPFKMPEFLVGKIRFAGPAPIRYYNYPTNSIADVNLENVSLMSLPDRSNDYNLNIAGKMDFASEGESIFHGFPFLFDGVMKLHFDPFKVNLEKYRIEFGNVKSRINLAMEIGDDSRLSSLQYDIAPASIMTLLGYLPATLLPNELQGMKSDIALRASIRLTQPWKFSASTLPSFAIDFSVPDSYLDYTLQGEGTYRLNNINVLGSFFFNGTDPALSTLDIKKIALSGEGLSLQADANVDILGKDPNFKVNASGDADLTRLMRFIPGMEKTRVEGQLDFSTTIKFLMSALMDGRITDINVEGTASLRDFLYSDLTLKTDIAGNEARFKFGSDVRQAGGHKIDKGMLAFSAQIDSIRYADPGMTAGGSRITFAGGSTRDMLNTAQLAKKQILPFGMTLGARSVAVRSNADSTSISAFDMRAAGALRRFEGNKRSPLVNFMLAFGRAGYRDPTSVAFVDGFKANLNLHLNQKLRVRKSRYQMRFDSIANAHPEISLDSVRKLASAGRRRNQPDNSRVSIELDRGVKNLIRKWDLSGAVKANRGMVSSYIYPARNFFSDLSLDFSMDSIALHSVRLRSQSNSLAMKGYIGNLRQFMLGSRRTPVLVRLTADIDTININQLAATYERGAALAQRLRERGYLPPEELAVDVQERQKNDSVTLLVPRNVDAAVFINANQCFYTNLNLFDLGSKLFIKNSVFQVDGLHADSDFGQAQLNMAYSTRDINDINASIDLSFDRIDITKFFQNFPQVEEMMPEMANLHGYVSAKAAASCDIFPNMDINIPTVRAVLDVRGNDLRVHQSQLIREITKRLFIRNKNDLKINNMVVQVSVHDNMLELYPFLFEIDRYRLGFLGQNDFDGNMYYHVSVLKSPIPFKFGINIKGTFDKFKIRFGGAKYKANQAADMVNIVDRQRVNLVKEMRHYLNEFVHKAAVSNPGSPGYNLLNSKEENDTPDASMLKASPLRIIMKNDSVLSRVLQQRTQKKK